MDPFEVLGLPHDERDETAVRKAYARLVRQHRPDRDPEGFRRVREAYEMALVLVRTDRPDLEDSWPLLEDEPEPVVETRLDPVEVPPPDPPPASRGDPLLAALARFAELRERVDPVRHPVLTSADLVVVEIWQREVLTRADQQPDILDDAVSWPDLILEANATRPLVAEEAIEHWARTENPALILFGRAYAARVGRLAGNHGLDLCGRLVYLMAAVETRPAKVLADELFRQSPTRAHAELDRVEPLLVVGRAIRNWPTPGRLRLLSALLAGVWPAGREDALARKIVSWVGALPKGPARKVLAELLPDLAKRARGIMSPARRTRRPVATAEKSGGSWVWIFALLFGLGTIGRLATDGGSGGGGSSPSLPEIGTRRPPQMSPVDTRIMQHLTEDPLGVRVKSYQRLREQRLPPEIQRKFLDRIDAALEISPAPESSWDVYMVMLLSEDRLARVVSMSILKDEIRIGTITPLLEAYRNGREDLYDLLRSIVDRLSAEDQARVREALGVR